MVGPTTSSSLASSWLLTPWLFQRSCSLRFDTYCSLILDVLPHWRRSRRSHDTKFVSRVFDSSLSVRTELTVRPVRVRNYRPRVVLTKFASPSRTVVGIMKLHHLVSSLI
jgi:hypothetical protein